MNTYDPEAHVYKINGRRVPGATDIIKAAGLIENGYGSEDAMWRGSCVHKGIELINKKCLDYDSVDERILPYLESYEQFLKVTDFKMVGVEEPCFAQSFACIPDLWGFLYDVPSVVEIKSGPIPAWASIQTALQCLALEKDKGFKAVKRFGLRLMPDGSLAKLEQFKDVADIARAFSLVDLFWWKVEKGCIRDWR